MIKVDLHMHSGEDPEDGLRYPATALVDKAIELGFGAIAITLHGKVLEDERVFAYAQGKGLLLIRAVEWSIFGRDVLLYNITQREAEGLLENVAGKYRFTEIVLHPHLSVKVPEDVERARKMMEEAHKSCLVSNSITTTVKILPDIRIIAAGE